MKIFKYGVPLTHSFTLDMPESASILDVQVQAGRPVIWALVDPDAPTQRREFRIYGTGHPIDDTINSAYIGTFQSLSDALVFHLFEVKL